MQRAGVRLTGTLAMAALIGLGACSRPADAVPAGPPESPLPSRAMGAVAPDVPEAAGVTEATCATAPLRVRVVAVRRETEDSVRMELALANLAPVETWTPGSPATAAVEAVRRQPYRHSRRSPATALRWQLPVVVYSLAGTAREASAP